MKRHAQQDFARLLVRIRSTYATAPGLMLTAAQGATLWSVGVVRAFTALQQLVFDGFLEHHSLGYSRPSAASDQAETPPSGESGAIPPRKRQGVGERLILWRFTTPAKRPGRATMTWLDHGAELTFWFGSRPELGVSFPTEVDAWAAAQTVRDRLLESGWSIQE